MRICVPPSHLLWTSKYNKPFDEASIGNLCSQMMQIFCLPLQIVLIIVISAFTTNLNAQISIPAIQSSEIDSKLKGRILIEELNCVACHQNDELISSSKKSPRLADIGSRLSPNYIENFIINPQSLKPGTMMPDILGQLDKKERNRVAKSLTHYLISLNKKDDFEVTVPDSVAAEKGELLFHQVGCAACHSPRDKEGNELMAEKSVPLGPLEKKYSHKGLTEFLKRPHAYRPSGRMPDLRLPHQDIENISHYLLRKVKVPGNLKYVTWRGKVWEGLEGDVNKDSAGQVEDFNLESIGKIHHQTAIKYSGYIRIENGGTYEFDIQLNGGSLSLNNKVILSEKPSNRRGIKRHSVSALLKKGLSEIEFTYFHTGRDPKLVFEMKGPGIKKGPIPSNLLTAYNKPIMVAKSLEPDSALATEGKEHFRKMGCANCHDDTGDKAIDSYPAMTVLRSGHGCLSGKAKSPRFQLNDDQKQLVQLALPTDEPMIFTDKSKIQKTLVQFNCIACHERAGVGGIHPERNKYFTSTKPELGNQGRIPPPLTHVGAKLTPSWLKEVMLNGGRQRFYLNTRMPVYKEKEVEALLELFEKNDSLEELDYPKITNIKESKNAGYHIMGTSGLSCIACHDFNGQKSGGAGALDIIHTTERLKKNWFHLYMRNPSRFHPTVIMPSYWPGGQALRREILGGKTDQQIEAIWNYLSDGDRAKNPKGLSRQSLTLKVADETVMCRGRGTAGYRGIGVGYPERISIAFDSEQMSLRQMWKGEFAHINHGSFHARGNERILFPEGIPFYRLASMDDAWPYKGKTDYLFPQNEGYQYKGYYLDPQKRPTFMYAYGKIKVDDYFEDQLDQNNKAYFERTITFHSEKNEEPFFFRLGAGKTIEEGNKSWKIDRLTLEFDEKVNAIVRDGDPKDLILPIQLNEGKTILKFNYKW